MPKLTVQPSGKTHVFKEGASLLELLLEQQYFVDNPCNGKGVCGKCRVKVISEPFPEATKTEKSLLSEEELEKGIRLACVLYPKEDLEVELLQKEREHKVLTSGYVPDFEFDCSIKKQVVEIHKPTLEDQAPFENQVLAQTKAKTVDFLALSSGNLEPGQVTAVIKEDTVIQIEKGDTTKELYGVAIDIGTTTVVCTLVNLSTGQELASSSMINAQKHFGLDVLTRITYELEHPEDGIQKLQTAIVDSINDMISDVCKQVRVDREFIYELTVGANCTMMHMLLGIDATPIGKAPYAPVFVEGRTLYAKEIGILAAKGARLYCLPSVSAYIGADIVAGAYVCDLKKKSGNTLFIDIGTNGEIVLSNNGHLLCCSCAAGPALEGMNISSGMRAAKGAIEDVTISPEGINLQVIGEEEPIGICGSGILAVVKELLKCGLVRKEGAFIKKEKIDEDDYRYPMIEVENKKRKFVLTQVPEKMYITQGDIRQVQLAKGAILSGFIALLNKAGITMDDLDQVMIAGQFGAHLPVESLTGTGILPEEVSDKLVYVGNSSKTGAYMALMSEQVKKEMEKLAQTMDYMELGATEGYERLFSECLIFPDFSKK
jgi:uncharacterized 2Fe-2S/4Fe-4S cluster protein (DUF4445 family)